MWHIFFPWYCFIFAYLSIPALAEVYSDISRSQQCSLGRPHFNYISCPLEFLCLQEFLSHSDPHSNLEFCALAGTSLDQWMPYSFMSWWKILSTMFLGGSPWVWDPGTYSRSLLNSRPCNQLFLFLCFPFLVCHSCCLRIFFKTKDPYTIPRLSSALGWNQTRQLVWWVALDEDWKLQYFHNWNWN